MNPYGTTNASLHRKDVCIRLSDIPSTTTLPRPALSGIVTFKTNALQRVKCFQVQTISLSPAWQINGTGVTANNAGQMIFLRSQFLSSMTNQNGCYFLCDQPYNTGSYDSFSDAITNNAVIGTTTKLAAISGSLINPGNEQTQENTNYTNPLFYFSNPDQIVQQFDWELGGWDQTNEFIELNPNNQRGSLEIVITFWHTPTTY